MIVDPSAELAALTAYVHGALPLEPELLTGERRALALLFQSKGRPASPQAASVWVHAVSFSVDLDLAELFQTPPENPDQIRQGLAQLAARRGLHHAGTALVRLAQGDSDDLAGEAEAILSRALRPLALVLSQDRTAEAFAFLEMLIEQGRQSGWSLSWSPVFSSIVGPVGPTTMMALAGFPGVGKTVWALQTALDLACQGVKTMFVSADMGAERLLTRAVSLLSGVSYAAIWRNKMTAFQKGQARAAKDELKLLPFKLEASADVINVTAKAKQQGIEAFFFDYVQLAHIPTIPGSDITTTQEGVTAATRLMRTLAHQAFVCVISQRKQWEESLAWSAALEQAPDVVFFMERVEGSPIVLLTFKKNRDGPTGSVPYYFHGPLMRMIELPVKTRGYELSDSSWT